MARQRLAPLLLLGLIAAAVLGRTPTGETPVRWTIRAPEAWMADFDGLRTQRSAALLANAPSTVAVQTISLPMPIVVAEADQPPRDELKLVPQDAPEPEITGSVPKGAVKPQPDPRLTPVINRSGKSDRLLAPNPLGRSTDRDLMVRPTLAVVPPSLDGWPPVTTLASLIAPYSAKVMPRLALARTGDDPLADPRIVVAMVRSGPGRVVTQSAIAALGTDGHRVKGRIVLPPVPDQQIAAVGPRSVINAMPAVPAMGYARRPTDVEYRFRALLGDEEALGVRAPTGDDQLPP